MNGRIDKGELLTQIEWKNEAIFVSSCFFGIAVLGFIPRHCRRNHQGRTLR